MGVVREMSVFIYHKKWNQRMSNNQDLESIGNKTEPDKKSEEKPSNLGKFLKSGGPGRPVGSLNKVPAELRAKIQAVFDNLGGVDGMTAWARRSDSNLTAFYKIVATTLPRQLAVAQVGHSHGLEKLSDQELLDIINGQKTNAVDIEPNDDTPSLPPSN
jgi:hypothetical protein